MIPIYCINLKRATERKQRIQEEWINNLNFNIKFWLAYDRRNIENNKLIYKYDSARTQKFLGRELSLGEIACATSYTMLYSYLLNNDYDEVIVMEDDISPTIQNKTELFYIIDKGKIEFPDAEMFILHGIDPRIDPMPIISKTYFSRYDSPPWGNMLMYLKRSAMNTLHNFLRQMICPADHPQKILFSRNQLDVIVSNKQLCLHNTNDTYIGNDLRFEKQIRKFIP